jgi:hypothetical protein
MVNANHAISSLIRRFFHECKRLRANEKELTKFSDAYFRYRDLLHEQQQIRSQILKLFGVLGVQSPDVTPELARLISPRAISSLDVRNELQQQLRLWEVLELFLWSVDNKATVGDFKDFLRMLDWNLPVTTQAVDSAVKAHPELFSEEFDGRDKFLALKNLN